MITSTTLACKTKYHTFENAISFYVHQIKF